MKPIFNIPNVLTISRILAIPFFAIGFFFESKNGVLFSLVIFVLCCTTDFLDGYLARTYKQTTRFGQMLDPMADKILVSVAILFIVGFDFIATWTLIPASVILSREIIISGVRDIVVQSNLTFKTSHLAKYKTAIQMLSISLILSSGIWKNFYLDVIGELLFWFSAIIAALSGILYCKRNLWGLV